MKVIRIICDKCHKAIDGNYISPSMEVCNDDVFVDFFGDLDVQLCTNCAGKVVDFIKALDVEQLPFVPDDDELEEVVEEFDEEYVPDPEPVKKKTTQKVAKKRKEQKMFKNKNGDILDVSKCKALRNAGWSIEKIADEFANKFSVSTIHRAIHA